MGSTFPLLLHELSQGNLAIGHEAIPESGDKTVHCFSNRPDLQCQQVIEGAIGTLQVLNPLFDRD